LQPIALFAGTHHFGRFRGKADSPGKWGGRAPEFHLCSLKRRWGRAPSSTKWKRARARQARPRTVVFRTACVIGGRGS